LDKNFNYLNESLKKDHTCENVYKVKEGYSTNLNNYSKLVDNSLIKFGAKEFKILEYIGYGKFSDVFKVNRSSFPGQSKFALKLINTNKMVRNCDKTNLDNEIFIHESLKHQSVVKFIEFGRKLDMIYILTEFIDTDLFNLIREKEERPTNINQSVSIIFCA
jgi:serine/threonine protein kinase